MKSKIKQEKGITLIALVVTIIVLLILAGISINALAGQNGILNRATGAKESQEKAQAQELAKLKLQELYTENLGFLDDASARTAITTELTSKGYEIKSKTTSTGTVKGILIKDSNGKSVDEVKVGLNATTNIVVELEIEGAGATKTYIKLKDKFYEMNITGLNVSISDEEYKDEDGSDDGYHIKITPAETGIEMTQGGTKITGETEIENGAVIGIKSGSTNGTYTFNVKEEKTAKTKDVNVTVAQIPADTAVENPESYGSNPNAQATADGAGKIFAKPEGATYVTGTVDTGVVVNIKGSEFVWVPVEDVVLDTSKEAKLPKSSSKGTSSGMTYTPMAVRVENNYKGILYNFSGSNGYLYYPNNANYQGSSTQYREPDVVSSYDGGSSDTVGIELSNLTSEYNAMIESVLKYKGFYVARYEAGLDANKNIVFKDAHITENNVTTTDASNGETKTWYGLYKKIKTFTTDSDKVVSSMIWGSQYDAMMNWMAKNNKTVGNSDSTKRNSGIVTGSEPKDVINNVYDLYGCHREWTLEALDTFSRVLRGGYSGSITAPSNRSDYTPLSAYSSYSSRATLYIKCNV